MVEFFLLTFSLRGEIKQNSKKTSSKNIFATFLFVQHFRSKSFYFYFIFANDTDSHKASLKVVKNDPKKYLSYPWAFEDFFPGDRSGRAKFSRGAGGAKTYYLPKNA